MPVGGATSSPRSTSNSVRSTSNNNGSSGGKTHTVKPGDSLSKIAQANNVSTQSVIDANPQFKNPDLIHPGDIVNIPGNASPAAAGQANATTQARDQYESGGRQSSSQNATTGEGHTGDANACMPDADPALASELSALRAGGGYRAAGGSGTAAPSEEQAAQGSLHKKAANGQTGSANIINGNSRSTSARATRYAGGRHTTTSRTDSTSDGETISSTRRGTARNNETGREHSATRTTEERVQDRTLSDNVSVGGVIAETNLAGSDDFHGLVTSNDTRHTADETGAGGEYHVLAAQGKAGAAATVDFRQGNINVGANASGQVDLVGVSGRAQLGSTSTAAGAGFVEGEAHVGARGEAGAGVVLNPMGGEVAARVGVEAFAGAEIRGTAGYENRYGGASVTGRGQAGIGGAASAEIGYSDGNLSARADLGAAIGLGGRVTIDVNVNIGNIASDAGSAIADTWNSFWD